MEQQTMLPGGHVIAAQGSYPALSRPSLQAETPYARPRSPLAPDYVGSSSSPSFAMSSSQNSSYLHKVRSTRSPKAVSSIEYSRAVPRASPLSMSGARSTTSNRGAGYDRSPSTTAARQGPPSRFFVTVLPPAELTGSGPDAVSTSRGPPFASTSHHRRGTLMPLFPTLGGQLYAISREYGLPSIGGLAIYLCDDGEGHLGPRVSEETWPYLWAQYFEEQSDSFYPDQGQSAFYPATSPAPPTPHDRSYSTASGVDVRIDGQEEGEELEFDMLDPRRPQRTASHQPSWANLHSQGSVGMSPRQLATPSPMRTSSRASRIRDPSRQGTPLGGGIGRLPIVARIEWAVDPKRAPWWRSFIGETNDVPRDAIPQASEAHYAPSIARTNGTGRRSLHLQGDREADTSIALSTNSGTAFAASSRDRRSHASTTANEPIRSSKASSISSKLGEYSQLPDHEESDPLPSTSASARQDVDAIQAPKSLYSVDQSRVDNLSANEDAVQGHASQSSLADDREQHTVKLRQAAFPERSSVVSHAEQVVGASDVEADDLAGPSTHRFDPYALNGTDEAVWETMQTQRPEGMADEGQQIEQDATVPAPARFSLIKRALSPTEADGHQIQTSSTVQEWIVKTQSPPMQQSKPLHTDAEGRSDESLDRLLSSQDDVADVIGLWAEKLLVEHQAQPAALPLLPRGMSTSISASDALTSRIPSFEHELPTAEPLLSRRQSTPSSARRLSELSDMPEPVTRKVSSNVPSANQSLQVYDRPFGINGSAAGPSASLLSPIALQEGHNATFGGPTPNLEDLLPADASEQEEEEETHEAARLFDEVPLVEEPLRTTRQGSLSIDASPSAVPLSPSQLDVPPARSPGQMSGSSSTSDMSDTLMDMERALALLSPAGFGPLAQTMAPTEVVSAKETRPGSKRSRFASHISASESMARARSLSASVPSPSPRLYRSPNADGTPAMPNVISPSEGSIQSHGHFADLQQQRLSKLPQSISPDQGETRARFPTTVASPLMRLPTDEVMVSPRSQVPDAVQQRALSLAAVGAAVAEVRDDNVDHGRKTSSQSGSIVEHPIGQAVMPAEETIDDANDANEEKNYAHVDEWIMEQQQRRRSSDADETFESRSREGSIPMTESQQPLHSRRVSTSSTPWKEDDAPRYATVGVQAEITRSEPSTSSFSLISGDEESEMEEGSVTEDADMERIAHGPLEIESNHGVTQSSDVPLHVEEEEEEEADAAAMKTPRPEHFSDVFGVSTIAPTATVVQELAIPGEAEASHTDQPNLSNYAAFEGMLRDNEITEVGDEPGDSVPDVTAVHPSAADHEEQIVAQATDHVAEATSNKDEVETASVLPEHEQDYTDSQPVPASQSFKSNLSYDQWSQDDSASDASVDDTHPTEVDHGKEPDPLPLPSHDVEARSIPSLHSGHSNVSSSVPGTLDVAGERTPTFLYEQRLADMDGWGPDRYGPSPSPISADFHSAQISPRPVVVDLQADAQPVALLVSSDNDPHKQTTAPAADAASQPASEQDQLDVQTPMPTARMPMLTAQELLSRKEIVSMAGEPVDENGQGMPNGFEQVHVLSPVRFNTMPSPGHAEPIRMRSYVDVVEKPIRRSMGSISDRRGNGRADARRASASPTSTATGIGKPIAMLVQAAKRASPRLMPQRDPFPVASRRSISPMSPRMRFGPLPPSPSLQGNTALLQQGGIASGMVSHGGGSSNGRDDSSALDFLPPQPAFSAQSSSYGSGSMSPSTHPARSPRMRSSPLVIDTAKAQMGAYGRMEEITVSHPSYDEANLSGSLPSTFAPPSSGPFRGRATSSGSHSTPPSPLGPRQQPFGTPPKQAVLPTAVPLA